MLIGKITKAHGIKGEVKVLSFSGQPENFAHYKQFTLVSEDGKLSPPYTVARARVTSKEVIISLQRVNDRNSAEGLCGYGVLVSKDALPKLSGDDYYLHELEGLQVVTENGQALGRIDSFFDNGAQDILVVLDGDEEILIPLIPGMIVQRDTTKITICPPPGLLDINSSEFGRE